jgi:hypothetical protein
MPGPRMLPMKYLLICTGLLVFAAASNYAAGPPPTPLKFVGDVPDRAKLQKVWAGYPLGFRIGQECIVREPKKWTWKKTYWGFYWVKGRTIYLNRKGPNVVKTFAHEYGHHCHATLLSEEQRNDWENHWQSQRPHRGANSGEGFADSCRYTFWEHPGQGGAGGVLIRRFAAEIAMQADTRADPEARRKFADTQP